MTVTMMKLIKMMLNNVKVGFGATIHGVCENAGQVEECDPCSAKVMMTLMWSGPQSENTAIGSL